MSSTARWKVVELHLVTLEDQKLRISNDDKKMHGMPRVTIGVGLGVDEGNFWR
jgi:hypothetical protein